MTKHRRPRQSDYDLVIPAVLYSENRQWGIAGLPALVPFLAGNTGARRRLFTAGLAKEPSGVHSNAAYWRCVLRGEDLDWLLEIAREHGEGSPWLWKDVLGLAYCSDVPANARNAVRKAVRKVDAQIIPAFDRARQKHSSDERRFQRKQRHREDDYAVHQIPLVDAVRSILRKRSLPLHEKMHRLSWCCFSEEHIRPNNLVGKWEDVPPELQARVFKTCVHALKTCDPTPIPRDSPYTVGIIDEADAFIAVLKHVSDFELTPDHIEKWLPATFVFGMADNDIALTRSFQTAREATEDVVVGETRRHLSGDRENVTLAANLPHEHWSKRLADGLSELLLDDTLNLQSRCTLLRVLAPHATEKTRNVIHAWLESRDPDPKMISPRQLAAIDALLVIDPPEALPLLAERVQRQGKSMLLERA